MDVPIRDIDTRYYSFPFAANVGAKASYREDVDVIYLQLVAEGTTMLLGFEVDALQVPAFLRNINDAVKSAFEERKAAREERKARKREGEMRRRLREELEAPAR